MSSSHNPTPPETAGLPSGADPALPELDGYDLVDRIGRGGMGVVYDAYQRATGRRVAVKFMLDSGLASETARRRFEREVELVARLQHPHIVAVVDSGIQRGRYYYVMEYVEGVTLDEHVRNGNSAELQDAGPSKSRNVETSKRRNPGHQVRVQGRNGGIADVLRLMASVADAVDHAHQRGVLHRDLKPSNILVDPEGKPHLLDFGLAKLFSEEAGEMRSATLSEPGQIIGTLAYMAPEQARGDRDQTSVRSDVYALGAIAYQAVTGKLPCATEGSLTEVLERIQHRDPPRASSIHRGIPADLDAILLKGLDKDPQRRYASAGDFAADVRRWLADEPVSARPASTLYQLRKFARRNKVLFGGVAATFVMLVLGIAATTWQAYRARQAERIALAQRDEIAREREKAQAEADKAAKVLGFLQKTMQTADPALTGRQGTTVMEALDRTVKDIGKEFAGQPLAEASLRTTLGGIYTSLGDLEEAEEQARSALAMCEREWGKESPQTLEAANAVAVVLLHRKNLAEAEPIARETLRLRKKVLGDTHPLVAESLNYWACLLMYQGELAEAEAAMEEALAIQQARLRDDDPEMVSTWEVGAQLAMAKGDYQAALERYQKLLVVQRKLYGDEHSRVAENLHYCAEALAGQGNFAAAEPLYRQSLELRRRLLGEEHPQVATSLDSLGSALYSKGDYAAAEPVYREALALRRKTLGENDPYVAVTLNNLAALRQAQGDYADSEALHREALALRRKLLGDDHPHVALSLHNLASLLIAQRKPQEAEPLYRQAIGIWKARFGTEHPDVAGAMASQAAALRDMGDAAAAEPILREALAIYERILPAGHATINTTRAVLGRLLLQLSRYSEAESLLLDVGQKICKNRASAPRSVERVHLLLIKLYEKWHAAEPGKGHDAKAAEWREKLAAWRATTQPGTTHPAGPPTTQKP